MYLCPCRSPPSALRKSMPNEDPMSSPAHIGDGCHAASRSHPASDFAASLDDRNTSSPRVSGAGAALDPGPVAGASFALAAPVAATLRLPCWESFSGGGGAGFFLSL